MYGTPFIALPSGVLIPGQTLPSGLIIPSPTISNPTFTGTVTATGTTVVGMPGLQNVQKSAVPFIFPSSHSMGNNGAITGLTALPLTYSGGAWMWMDANQIAAGSSAGWYWFVASSTTAGTLYNSTYVGPGVPGLGTTTAFVTTGPGANTGSTAEVFGPQITIPVLGTNAKIEAVYTGQQTSNANGKTLRVRFSGTAGTILSSGALASQAQFRHTQNIRNRGSASLQISDAWGVANNALYAPGSPVSTTQNTGSTSILVFSMQRTTATDNVILESLFVAINDA